MSPASQKPTDSQTSAADLSAWLQQLPVHEPPARLWPRILQSRLNQQQRMLRQRTAIAAAALAACLVMAVVLFAPIPGSSPQGAPDDLGRMATLMQRTGHLEQELQQRSERFAELAAARQHLVLAQQAQLVALDQSLANAYSRRDSPARLADLWQRRVQLMQDLVILYDGGAAGDRT